MSAPEPIHFLNGSFITERELFISPRDLGYTRGYAVFDFLITYRGHRPFMLARHAERLINSAHMIGLALPWGADEVSAHVNATLAKNEKGGEKAIRIIVSGGSSTSLLPAGKPTLIILIDLHQPLPAKYYKEGAPVISTKYTRYTPAAKTNNYIEAVKQAQAGQTLGSVETVYYDDTQVFEGSASNIFALVRGTLLTPKSNILEGITRRVLLDTLRLSVPLKVADFSRDELMRADEVFLTASNKEVLPVTRIDDHAVGTGQVGEVTKEVMRQFRAFVESDAW